jgi:hypothetical protein
MRLMVPLVAVGLNATLAAAQSAPGIDERASALREVFSTRATELGGSVEVDRCALESRLGRVAEVLRILQALPDSVVRIGAACPGVDRSAESDARWELIAVTSEGPHTFTVRGRYVVPCSRARFEAYRLQRVDDRLIVIDMVLSRSSELACQPLIPGAATARPAGAEIHLHGCPLPDGISG